MACYKNVKIWKANVPGGKWRWMLYDMEFGMQMKAGQYAMNAFNHATAIISNDLTNQPWSTLLLRKLFNDEDFSKRFVNRYLTHLNTTFDVDRMLGIIEQLEHEIEPEIPRFIERWGNIEQVAVPYRTTIASTEEWENKVSILKEFVEKRNEFVMNHISEKFGYGNLVEFKLKNDDLPVGEVYLNGVKIGENKFEGMFFEDIPLQLEVRTVAGYTMKGWESKGNSLFKTIDLKHSHKTTLKYETIPMP